MKKSNVVQPEGNYYDKYNSSNPIVRWMMKNFFISMEECLSVVGKFDNVLEAGCGEGEVANFIAEKFNGTCQYTSIDAFDVSDKVIKKAQEMYPNINFFTGSIYEIARGGYDLVVCSEVLEHLEEPEKALFELKKTTDKYLLVSVPREPVWCVLNMVRGKYLRDFGNTPGHIQHWSKKKFLEFLKCSGMNIRKVKSPLPWTMVLLEKE